MTALLFLIAALLLLQGERPLPSQSTPQDGKGVVRVTVKQKDTGVPITAAMLILRLRPASGQPTALVLNALTDAIGTAVFERLPIGEYTLSAQRENYFSPAQNGAPTVVTMDLVLDSAHTTAAASLVMVPGGTVSGFVRDADGTYASKIPVSAHRITFQDGRRILLGPKKSAESTDEGRYQLSGLSPGDYYIRSGAWDTPVYFPGVTKPEGAALIRIRAGEEMSANLQLQRERSVKISGKVLNTLPDATPLSGFLLLPRDLSGIYDAPQWRVIRNEAQGAPDGRFEVHASRPGSYNLIAVTQNFRMGKIALEISDRDISDVELNIERGSQVAVNLAPTDAPQALLEAVRVALSPVEMIAPPLTQSLTTFRKVSTVFENVPQGTYAVAFLPLPRGLYLADIRQGARSVMDTGVVVAGQSSSQPVEIVMGVGGAKIEGSAPRANRVSLIPQAPRRENRQLVRNVAVVNGRFELVGVTPGEYRIFAWDDLPSGADESIEFMTPYEQRGRLVKVTGNDLVLEALPPIRLNE